MIHRISQGFLFFMGFIAEMTGGGEDERQSSGDGKE